MRLSLLLILSQLFGSLAFAAPANKWDIYQLLNGMQAELPSANLNQDELTAIQQSLLSAKNIMDQTSANPALLSLSDGPTSDFGTVHGSTDKTFTVTNSGGQDATSISGYGLAQPFSFKGGSYPGTGGTCGATLASSTTCTIAVTYAPVVAGSASATVVISYFDSTATQTANRSIQGMSN